MYNPKVTEQQLFIAKERMEKRLKIRIDLKRYSISNCMAWMTRLREAGDLVEGTGGRLEIITKRPLTPEEASFVRSERLLCAWDYRYWAERYHRILNWENQTFIRFVPNVAQEIVLDVISNEELLGHSVRMQNLKARQLGITTLMESLAEHRVMFHPNTKAIVGSAAPDKSKKMVMMVEASWMMMPWWLMPSMTARQSGEMIEFGGLGSNLSIRHGTQKTTDVGRGETPNFAHLSEIVDWANPEADIDAGLMMAMHSSPSMFLALESTAGYIGDWWHELWKFNKSRYGSADQPPRLIPLFLPWFIGKDIYPTETDMREHPVPILWRPAELTRQHAVRAAEYVKNSPILSRHMGEGWEMPIEQQWYWEYTRDYYKRTGKLNTFLREMPANDIEAFNSKYSSVFDAEVIEHYSLVTKMPERIFCLDGPIDEIRPELKPDYRQQDPNIKPIIIDKKWTLVPIKKDGYPDQIGEMGKIFIWEMPKDGSTYGLGVDTSKGIGQDRSVIQVLRKATIDLPPRQCAEFAHDYVSANDLSPWVHCLAKIFSVKRDDEICQPKLIIETNNGGDACQLAMRKLGWYNFHNWERYDKKKSDEGKANFLGFIMVEWARELVVGGLIKALKDSLIDIDSPWLIEEMAQLEKNDEKRRIEAGGKGHDDRFMSLGMVLLSLHARDWGSLKSPFGRSRVQSMEDEKVNIDGREIKEDLPIQASRKSWTELALQGINDEVPLQWKEGGYGDGEWQDSAPFVTVP